MRKISDTTVSDKDALTLEKAGRAKPFFMESEWFQDGKGQYIIRSFWWDYFSMTWSNPKSGSSSAHVTVVQQKGQKAVRPK